ncbi:sensor histidine kinase [Acinetobacter haemolyticus]|uniref:sensor histidine kinase n=1 Tax=Acinetobacter haemolyticus TaxID=29430 RepID=UPI001331D9DF|nr:HAMP domain-containing sensor histidine kinase [Acinetobacter haemolyticus]NAR17194.1 sensor histidine kinase [Acinetobacter haemolyticus]NAR30451.1 sensor histidine kinase [Acinetobacter haemolyticus]NAR35790.1 sensor histidine kinase [Acinetobacter haemolyticus]NAR76097.1 sensor histidine kinase [Acinetobacter haemolyticus]NCU22078.1 sensor histidine kinase [Acinetobacter haemolyticus]
MAIQLLELQQADKLSACKISLSLGLNSEQNLIEQFLQFNRKLMQASTALLAFHQEPYLWHRCPEKLQAIDSTKIAKSLNTLFVNNDLIDCDHPRYPSLMAFLNVFKKKVQRAVALHLRHPDQTSLGYVILFDEEAQAFSKLQTELLQAHCRNFMQQLELKFNHDELKELYEQEAALNVSKTKFFSIISHDLRAPFHGLLGFSEILAKERETLDESSIQNIADYLHDTSQSTYNLLESLLNWAMAEGGRFVYHPINFKLRQITNIVTDILKTLALKKHIELVNEVDENLKVYADMNMITSVIQNLVSNALKFTDVDGSGKVYIKAKAHGDVVEIYIKDTGLGMTPDQLKDLFQPRITISLKGTAGEKGAGLGLALCKRFVEMNHGKISASSKEGEGTLFKVVLPVAREHVDLCVEQNKSQEKLV